MLAFNLHDLHAVAAAASCNRTVTVAYSLRLYSLHRTL